MSKYSDIVNFFITNGYVLSENSHKLLEKNQQILQDTIDGKFVGCLESSDGAIENLVGCIFKIKKDYDNMSKYYLTAIEKGNSDAMTDMGLYCEEHYDYKEMIKYYLMAIEKGNPDAMFYLGDYYDRQNNYSEMMKYYTMAIEKGNSYAMHYLGSYYNSQNNYSEMMKYYTMAIEKGNSYTMHSLAIYYEDQCDHENAKKYYLMAIDKNDSNAMCNFGSYYKKQSEYESMMKYYLMGASCGNYIGISYYIDECTINEIGELEKIYKISELRNVVTWKLLNIYEHNFAKKSSVYIDVYASEFYKLIKKDRNNECVNFDSEFKNIQNNFKKIRPYDMPNVYYDIIIISNIE